MKVADYYMQRNTHSTLIAIQTAADFNFTPLIAAALLYLAVTVPLARLLDRWGYAETAR